MRMGDSYTLHRNKNMIYNITVGYILKVFVVDDYITNMVGNSIQNAINDPRFEIEEVIQETDISDEYIDIISGKFYEEYN